MFTAKDVMTLRELTGVGMMDCKKALTECDGDMEKAKDYLREKGLAAAAKKAGRIAAEGVVESFLQDDRRCGALVEVNCETDFVAKTDDFKAFVHGVAEQVEQKNPASMEALLEQPSIKSSGLTVDQMLNEAVAKIGEKVSIRRFARYELAGTGVVDSYIHMGGKIGVLLEVGCGSEGVANNPEFQDFAHDVALQIAAAKPIYIRTDEVPQDEVEKEKSILRAQALAEDKPKPENIIEKMVNGRVQKYYKEVCLLEQVCVKNTDITVKQLVAEMEKQFGETIEIRRFDRFEMGEGLQKREDNFADEVMSQMK